MNALRFSRFGWSITLLLFCALTAHAAEDLSLKLRRQVPSGEDASKWRQQSTRDRWNPRATAVIICDMWDRHWCQGATARVAAMAPRMNDLLKELRHRGVLIIHCPSDTMSFYQEHPGRKLARSAPKVELPAKPGGWCALNKDKEPDLPIEVIHDGCDDLPPCQPPKNGHYPWTRQIATLEIEPGDVITDNVEAIYLLKQRGITNVLILGVHVNMCVLGRPFGIRQLVYQGFKVALVRDLTDAMYCSRGRPYVNHFTGNDLVIGHIEQYWCSTVTSDQIIGGKPYRFPKDVR
ncbi:MAG TPA: protein-signal peptide and transmembrane prediction [Candidatus Paceibacterota bacterium]|nr:protein-signal peptide and transmembrane prediction [Candidatus Paceibacterota bacterium]